LCIESSAHDSDLQESPSLGHQHEHHTESTSIHNIEIAQDFCDDEEENFRFSTLEELESWAKLLSEYQHERYKHLAPHFEQAQKILEIIQTLIWSHIST
jgi:hypothetical protein